MERFTSNYTKFYDSVKEITPSLFKKEVVPSLPETDVEKVNFFVKNWYPHMEKVSKGDLKYFEDNKISPDVFQNLKFLDLISNLSQNNKDVIWEYLHSLYAFSINSKHVKENFCSGEVVTNIESSDVKDTSLKEIRTAIDNFPEFVTNMVSWKRDRKDQNEFEEKSSKSSNKKSGTFDEKAFENSSLAKIAKEISDEINPEEILNLGGDMKNMDDPMKLLQSLLSGDQSNGIGKLMTTVVDKLKNKMDSGEMNQEDLLKESMSMFTSMGGGGGGGGGPDMAGMMKMMQGMQGLGGLGDLFGGGGSGGSRSGRGSGGSRRSSRQVRRRMEKKLRKNKDKMNNDSDKKSDKN